MPASRPRVTRWGTYYTKTYAAWKKAAEASTPRGPGEILCPLLVLVDVVVEKPRTSKLEIPKGDADNYAKAALDVITKVGGYWQDDKQVASLSVIKRFAGKDETPHTEVHIFKCDSRNYSRWNTLWSTALQRLLKLI